MEDKKIVEQIPEEYKPISMWGYFGYNILFSLPLIGLILLLIFSFGGTRNINLKNYARSFFCYLILIVIIVGILVLIFIGDTAINSLWTLRGFFSYERY